MRKALQLEIAGHRLFGTQHDNDSCLLLQNKQDSQRIGVLLLSFGQQPRSWVGDLGSSIADRLEALGYPTFRFDMPGLGDSPGYIPVYLEDLWREILLGAHEPLLHGLCEHLTRHFSLKGLVVGGFCGGAVTALYAINARSPLILGLVLLEPEMAMVRISSSSVAQTPAPLTVDAYHNSINLILRRVSSLDSWRRLFTGKADFNYWLKLWYALLDYSVRKLKTVGHRTKVLPQETNHRMLNSWQIARRLRIPTLTISVGSPNRRKYYGAYGLESGVNDQTSNLRWVEIPNTTHAMLTGGAKEAVGKHIESWITETFPFVN